jgi:hypothetical protein
MGVPFLNEDKHSFNNQTMAIGQHFSVCLLILSKLRGEKKRAGLIPKRLMDLFTFF